MASSYIPVTAEQVGYIECHRQDGVSKMTAYRGQRSRGYRSNYTPEPCYWIKLEMPGERTQRWSLVPTRFAQHVRASKRDLSKVPERSVCLLVHVEGVYADTE